MREIKFRAWDMANERIINNPEFRGVAHTLEDIFTNDAMPFVWMQYTGLKDKNGKEIYEGDIVKFTRRQGYSWFRRGSVAQVSWYDFQYTGFGFDENCGLTKKKSKEIEIIGNIYENPELLT